MATELRCYRCGADLARLTLPLSRLDVCPGCGVELHVCRMCAHYAAAAPGGCTEDDAEEIHEKARANFCEYFSPSPSAFDGALATADERARGELAALFGEGAGDEDKDADGDDTLGAANALFDR